MSIIQSLLSYYERDRIRPRPEMIVRFVLVLGVTADGILGLAKPSKSANAFVSRSHE